MGLFVLNECIILSMYNAEARAHLSTASSPHCAGKMLLTYSSLVLIAQPASSFPFFGPFAAFWQSMMNSLPFGVGAFCILTQGGTNRWAHLEAADSHHKRHPVIALAENNVFGSTAWGTEGVL